MLSQGLTEVVKELVGAVQAVQTVQAAHVTPCLTIPTENPAVPLKDATILRLPTLQYDITEFLDGFHEQKAKFPIRRSSLVP